MVQISRVAAIREILGPSVHYQYDMDISSPNSRPDVKRKRHSTFSEAVKLKKVKPASKTFLTPIVNRIAKDLFKGSLEVAEFGHYEERHCDTTTTKRRQHKAHHTNPAKIIWGERLVEEEHIYSSVTVDGIHYQVGQLDSFWVFSHCL